MWGVDDARGSTRVNCHGAVVDHALCEIEGDRSMAKDFTVVTNIAFASAYI